ncbi:SIS domain-containing protein [Nitrosopumilus sp.]|uniref:SIS domain-containing protein n=1 Tax=Nitrosopumilus sp. TaxID=2024843 RepID=UPI003D0C82DF
MISKAELEKIDSKKMFEIYDNWPEIARKSYHSNLESIDFGEVKHIVFAGMGGSGTLGDFFSAILSKTSLHVNVVKGYLLPNSVDVNTLVVTTSVSGDTVETLSVLKAAQKIGCKVIAFSSGGKMEKFCIENTIQFKKIKKYHSPRASFVSFLYSMLKILESNIPVDIQDILNSLEKLEDTGKEISSKNISESNGALKLANSLTSIPVIYYPWGLEAAAIRFKSSLQENSKIHAIVEDVVEASHNGIVAWEVESNTQPILLLGKDDYIKTKERWEIFEEYFNLNKIKFEKIISKEGNIITKLINLIYFLDYTSIYLAVKKGIDPTPVKPINFIKNHL